MYLVNYSVPFITIQLNATGPNQYYAVGSNAFAALNANGIVVEGIKTS